MIQEVTQENPDRENRFFGFSGVLTPFKWIKKLFLTTLKRLV
jgi:hypothetical protein